MDGEQHTHHLDASLLLGDSQAEQESLRLRRASVQSVDSNADELRQSTGSIHLPWAERGGGWWLRRLAACLGASAAARAWRWAVNGMVALVVAFEVLWWSGVAWRERDRAGVCVVGACIDALRGALSSVVCGGGALLVARAWLDELLSRPAGGAVIDNAGRRWTLAACIYVGLDSGWMAYRNVDLGFRIFAADVEAGETRVAIGSSNFASGAVLLGTQWAFIVALGCACTQASEVRVSTFRLTTRLTSRQSPSFLCSRCSALLYSATLTFGELQANTTQVGKKMSDLYFASAIAQCLHAIEVQKLSAPQLVEAFRSAKAKHDRLLGVAHGSAFVTAIVVYYFRELRLCTTWLQSALPARSARGSALPSAVVLMHRRCCFCPRLQ